MRWVLATGAHPPVYTELGRWTAAVASALVAAGDDVRVRVRRGRGQGSYPVRRLIGEADGWLGWLAALQVGLRAGDRLLTCPWTLAAPLVDTATRVGVPVDVAFLGRDLTVPAGDAAAFQRVCDAAARRLTGSAHLAELVRSSGFAAHVLPAPVDPGPPRTGARTPAHWGLVADATPLAGGERFVRLVAAAGVQATVVASGPARVAWEALAASLGADVRFVSGDPSPILPTLDLAFLLPRTERDGTGAVGLGLSLYEAAAVGVPAVGCRVGGVPEATGPGLVLDDPDDVPASLAAIRAWYTPDRGREAREHLGDVHGTARTAAALRG